MKNQVRSKWQVVWSVICGLPWWPGMVGLAIGPFVGLAVLTVFGFTQPYFYATLGALGCFAIGLLIGHAVLGSRLLVLSEATVSATQFAEFKFVICGEHKRVAWKLFVELMSRISTQPLEPDSGLLREALTSLYGLFATTRDLLKQMNPSKAGGKMTVEMLALTMLNKELRPFLARWHPSLKQFEATNPSRPESEWPEALECRTALEALRQRLIPYGRSLGELADVSSLEHFFSPVS